jgi:hypothetical protein
MTRWLLLIALCAASSAGFQSPAQAQRACAGIRMVNGDCFDRAQATAARKTVVYMTQPKFSYTAPPWLPNEDHDSYTARDHHEISTFFTFPFPFLTQIKP